MSHGKVSPAMIRHFTIRYLVNQTPEFGHNEKLDHSTTIDKCVCRNVLKQSKPLWKTYNLIIFGNCNKINY